MRSGVGGCRGHFRLADYTRVPDVMVTMHKMLCQMQEISYNTICGKISIAKSICCATIAFVPFAQVGAEQLSS